MNKYICLLSIFFILLFLPFAANVHSQEQSKHLTVILVPNLSFQEINWLLEYGSLVWKKGGMAAMNIRPDGPYSYLNNTVTIGAGARGLGVEGWNAFTKGEIEAGVAVDELYQQWTGKLVEEQKVFHPLFHKLVDKNNSHSVEVGKVGQLLKDHNVASYVVGTSDCGSEKTRYGPLLTMDQQGMSEGLLTDVMKKSNFSPCGMVVDANKVVEVLSTVQATNKNSFFVIEWGDLFRLYKQKGKMANSYFSEQYVKTLTNLDLLVTALVEKNYSQNVMLLSPMVHTDAYQNKERLAPFFYFVQGDYFFLNSETTRQQYVVSNLDVVPTILSFFQIEETNQFIGKPFTTTVSNDSTLQEGLKKIELMFVIFKTRNVVLSTYITLLVVMLIVTSIVIMFKDQNELWKYIAKILLIGGISSPLWLLITPYSLNYIQPNIYIMLLLLCSALTGIVFVKFIQNPIFVMSTALFIAITIDLLMSNYFMQRSYLGYDPVIGARYYGIGNEYAGVYLISALLLLQNKWLRKKLVLSFFVITSLLLISGTNLGANAGATLSAGIMFGYFTYRIFFPNVSGKKLFLIFSCLVLITLSLLFLTQIGGRESHIGFAFAKLLEGDYQFIFETIKRKLEMNWKIFKFSNWTQLFVTTYLLIAIYLWRKKAIVPSKMKRIIIQTGVVASIALLLLNDSGVVAAATSMFIIVCTSYYWALETKNY